MDLNVVLTKMPIAAFYVLKLPEYVDDTGAKKSKPCINCSDNKP